MTKQERALAIGVMVAPFIFPAIIEFLLTLI